MVQNPDFWEFSGIFNDFLNYPFLYLKLCSKIMEKVIRWFWFNFSDVVISYPSYPENCKAVNSQMDFVCLFLCFFVSLFLFWLLIIYFLSITFVILQNVPGKNSKNDSVVFICINICGNFREKNGKEKFGNVYLYIHSQGN